jgi:hypothetical protein
VYDADDYDEEEDPWDPDEDDEEYYEESEVYQPPGGVADTPRRPPVATKPSRRKNGSQDGTSRTPDNNGQFYS